MTHVQTSHFAPTKCRVFTSDLHILNKIRALSRKNSLWGSTPNKPPTKTSWLALQSLYWCGYLFVKTTQLCLDYYNIGSTVSSFLLYFLDVFFRDYCSWTVALHLFMSSLHLCDLGFNRGCHDECLIDPWLYACLQDNFLMSWNVYLLLEQFFLLHPPEPLCKGHCVRGPIYVIILLLQLMCLYF